MRTGSAFTLALCLAIPLALAACGGGGGTPTKTAMPNARDTGAPPETPGTPETWPVRTEAERDEVAAAGLEKLAESIGTIADATPRFGSVTQSTNGVTGATANFDIASKALNVSFGAPQTITCDFSCYWNIEGVNAVRNSDTGTQLNNPLRYEAVEIQQHLDAPPTAQSFYEKHNDRFFVGDDQTDTLREYQQLRGPVDDSDGMGVRIVETANGDGSRFVRSNIITRYFINKASVPESHRNTWSARGHYLAYAGRNLISTAPAIERVVLGVFIDGPEYREPPKSLPTNLRAHYMGSASGFAVIKHRSGSPVSANWNAAINLVANFNSVSSANRGSIRGYIGAHNSQLDGYTFIGYDSLKYRVGSNYTSMYNYAIQLDTAHFQRDGTFTGNARIIRLPYETGPGSQPPPQSITSSNGKWGGKFSNLPIPGTNTPSAVGGTVGTKATFQDGRITTFAGTFEASRDPTRDP